MSEFKLLLEDEGAENRLLFDFLKRNTWKHEVAIGASKRDREGGRKGWLVSKEGLPMRTDQKEWLFLLNVWIDFRKCMNWFRNMGSCGACEREKDVHESRT